MSRNLNKAFLIGRLGADPEIRTTAGGARVASFSVATGRRGTPGSGSDREKTDWHRIIAWDRLADVAERYLRKGDRVYAEGRIEYRSWRDSSGRTRYSTEVVAQELIVLDGAVAAPAAV